MAILGRRRPLSTAATTKSAHWCILFWIVVTLLSWNEVLAFNEEHVPLQNGDDSSSAEQQQQQAHYQEGDDHHHDASEEPRVIENDIDPISPIEPPRQNENGILVAQTIRDFEDIFRLKVDKDQEAVILFALVYTESCPQSMELLERFEEAHILLTEYFETTTDAVDTGKRPIFVRLQASTEDPVSLEAYGISSFPTMMFLMGNDPEKDPLWLVYAHRHATAADIYQAALHYYFGLIVAAGDLHYTDEFINVQPKQFASQVQVQAFVRDHRHGLLDYATVEPGLSPNLPEPVKEYIRWLLYSSEEEDGSDDLIIDDTKNDSDDFVLFVQCRNEHTDHNSSPFYDAFQMARVLASRCDRLFVTITECDEPDGSVTAYKLPLNYEFTSDDNDWFVPIANFVPAARELAGTVSDGVSQAMIEFLMKVSTPSVLWFDRQATAPIAFPVYRKVHAVLFVDLHHVDTDVYSPSAIQTRRALRRFQRTCRNHRREDETAERDMVCLVVPSTETRVLATLGIDIWTVLDQRINPSDASNTLTEPLPALMVTDQRFGGTKRYYLGSSEIDSTNNAISNFVANFWQGGLTPRIKSSKGGVRTNASGVRFVTGDTFQTEVLQADEGKHALVFFTAPTCGHCKRFSILWNRLAELIFHIGWDSFLTLYQMDVTTDEIVDLESISVKWVPDVYYFAPNSRGKPVRYDLTDELGEGVGRHSNPIELLQWLIYHGDFEEEQLRQLLLDLSRTAESTPE